MMAGNMPDDWGQRPGDYEYMNAPNPNRGCNDCGLAFHSSTLEDGACPECGGADFEKI